MIYVMRNSAQIFSKVRDKTSMVTLLNIFMKLQGTEIRGKKLEVN